MQIIDKKMLFLQLFIVFTKIGAFNFYFVACQIEEKKDPLTSNGQKEKIIIKRKPIALPLAPCKSRLLCGLRGSPSHTLNGIEMLA